MTLIELVNIVKRYKDKIVLKDINFKFRQSKTYLLIGENGSGKTTLIKMIIGTVLKSSGVIKKTYNSFGYLPDKCSFPNHLSVGKFLNLFHDLDEFETIKILQKWDLAEQKNKKIIKLSKGMFQKLMIINMLLEDRKIYILDEPLNGLDENSKKKLLIELNELSNNNKTVIIATHFRINI